jgi:nucleotide-binding universal stress UspA family protein
MNAASFLARWGRYPDASRSVTEEPHKCKRVLIPLDGSRVAERIIPFVLQIAGPLHLEIVLVRVVGLTPPTILDGTRDVVMYDVPARLKEARRYLARIVANLRERGVRVTAHARYGIPFAQIVAVAREAAADLIAMATRGGNGAGWSVVDSVAGAVLREAEVPVLVMGAARREAQAARAA